MSRYLDVNREQFDAPGNRDWWDNEDFPTLSKVVEPGNPYLIAQARASQGHVQLLQRISAVSQSAQEGWSNTVSHIRNFPQSVISSSVNLVQNRTAIAKHIKDNKVEIGASVATGLTAGIATRLLLTTALTPVGLVGFAAVGAGTAATVSVLKSVISNNEATQTKGWYKTNDGWKNFAKSTLPALKRTFDADNRKTTFKTAFKAAGFGAAFGGIFGTLGFGTAHAAEANNAESFIAAQASTNGSPDGTIVEIPASSEAEEQIRNNIRELATIIDSYTQKIENSGILDDTRQGLLDAVKEQRVLAEATLQDLVDENVSTTEESVIKTADAEVKSELEAKPEDAVIITEPNTPAADTEESPKTSEVETPADVPKTKDVAKLNVEGSETAATEVAKPSPEEDCGFLGWRNIFDNCVSDTPVSTVVDEPTQAEAKTVEVKTDEEPLTVEREENSDVVECDHSADGTAHEDGENCTHKDMPDFRPASLPDEQSAGTETTAKTTEQAPADTVQTEPQAPVDTAPDVPLPEEAAPLVIAQTEPQTPAEPEPTVVETIEIEPITHTVGRGDTLGTIAKAHLEKHFPDTPVNKDTIWQMVDAIASLPENNDALRDGIHKIYDGESLVLPPAESTIPEETKLDRLKVQEEWCAEQKAARQSQIPDVMMIGDPNAETPTNRYQADELIDLEQALNGTTRITMPNALGEASNLPDVFQGGVLKPIPQNLLELSYEQVQWSDDSEVTWSESSNTNNNSANDSNIKKQNKVSVPNIMKF